jgi:hypothetical protein
MLPNPLIPPDAVLMSATVLVSFEHSTSVKVTGTGVMFGRITLTLPSGA